MLDKPYTKTVANGRIHERDVRTSNKSMHDTMRLRLICYVRCVCRACAACAACVPCVARVACVTPSCQAYSNPTLEFRTCMSTESVIKLSEYMRCFKLGK